jgi:hypothetical protein
MNEHSATKFAANRSVGGFWTNSSISSSGSTATEASWDSRSAVVPTPIDPRILAWNQQTGYAHNRLDDGECDRFHYKLTPLMVADAVFDKEMALERFRKVSERLHSPVTDFIVEKIEVCSRSDIGE